MFDLIVAHDAAYGIGKDGTIPWKSQPDLRLFRSITTGRDANVHAVIMGRRTWESLPPAHRPLKDRLNIVITSRLLQVPNEVVVCSSLQDAMSVVQDHPMIERGFIIGGAHLYHAYLRECPDAWAAGAGRIYRSVFHRDYGCDVTLNKDMFEHVLSQKEKIQECVYDDFRFEVWH